VAPCSQRGDETVCLSVWFERGSRFEEMRTHSPWSFSLGGIPAVYR
jgi:hypothetical protein